MNVDYRDKSKAITAEDLIRRYNLDGLSKDRKALKTLNDGLTKQDTIIEEYVKNTTKYVTNQVDNFVTTWFFSGVPTLENKPFIDFSEDEKSSHVEDIYYDKETGYIYQLRFNNEVYSWELIDDDNLRNSLAIANSSADAFDNKRNLYYSTPSPPYQVGDVWYDNGTVKRCRATRTEGEYHSTDLCLQKDYTDENVLLDRTAVLDQVQKDVQTNYESIASLETTTDSIESKVQSNTTEIQNSKIEINDKFNDYALSTTVTEQINSVEQKITDNDLEINIVKETLQNGVSKVKTEKGFTFDDEGLTIDDSNGKVKNTLDENGMEITDKSSNETLLFAGYDAGLQETVVISKNLTVQKYLNIPHARFEKYNNPVHGEGAGCFYME